jgi:hypothetical protein
MSPPAAAAPPADPAGRAGAEANLFSDPVVNFTAGKCVAQGAEAVR